MPLEDNDSIVEDKINMSITVKSKGDFSNTKNFLVNANRVVKLDEAEKIAIATVNRLKAASPYPSIAEGWSYEIQRTKKGIAITFNNSCVENGANIALLVDSGYATKGGKWVSGKHYIKEPIQQAFDDIMNHTWEALRSL